MKYKLTLILVLIISIIFVSFPVHAVNYLQQADINQYILDYENLHTDIETLVNHSWDKYVTYSSPSITDTGETFLGTPTSVLVSYNSIYDDLTLDDLYIYYIMSQTGLDTDNYGTPVVNCNGFMTGIVMSNKEVSIQWGGSSGLMYVEVLHDNTNFIVRYSEYDMSGTLQTMGADASGYNQGDMISDYFYNPNFDHKVHGVYREEGLAGTPEYSELITDTLSDDTEIINGYAGTTHDVITVDNSGGTLTGYYLKLINTDNQEILTYTAIPDGVVTEYWANKFVGVGNAKYQLYTPESVMVYEKTYLVLTYPDMITLDTDGTIISGDLSDKIVISYDYLTDETITLVTFDDINENGEPDTGEVLSSVDYLLNSSGGWNDVYMAYTVLSDGLIKYNTYWNGYSIDTDSINISTSHSTSTD